MEYALIISLVVNIVFAVLWFRRTSFYHCRFIFWFRKRPDFAKAEETARRIIGEASFGDLLDFDGFEAREWMADLTVRHKSLDKERHADTYKAVQTFVTRLSKETGLPCWPYGWSMDKDNPRLNVGSLIGIGYGSCGCGRKQKKKTEPTGPGDGSPRA